MPITKDKKKDILKDVAHAVDSAKSLVFLNFHGLNVSIANEMRRALRGAEVKYFVAKKSLVKRALGESKVSGEMPALPGELAVAWSEDLTAPAREIYAFQKKNPENIKIVGGIFEGKYMDMAAMMEIATIPALPVLHGKFVNIINSPIQRFVIGLGAIASKKTE